MNKVRSALMCNLPKIYLHLNKHKTFRNAFNSTKGYKHELKCSQTRQKWLLLLWGYFSCENKKAFCLLDTTDYI